MRYGLKKRLIFGASLILLLALYIFKNLSMSTRIFGVLAGLWVFYFIDHAFDNEFTEFHYLLLSILLLFGILLSPLYFIYDSYDKVLHLILPIIGCVLIFYIINKKNLTLQWKLFITFIFIVSFIALHEIGEYLMDLLWDLRLQGVYLRDITGLEKFDLVLDKNDDTMIDMILGVIGSLIFISWKVITHYYQKHFVEEKPIKK